MKIFSSLIILIFPIIVSAQKADTKKNSADTLRNRFSPTGIRIGTDLIDIAKSRYVDSFKGWEINGDVDFGRYYLALDYGSWGRTYHQDAASFYTNDGRYFRAGIDVNFLTKDPEKNMFFIGFRYGRSVFSEDYTLTKNDSTWGTGVVTYNYTNEKINGRWLELTTGIRVRMWKFIWMGYTARFKFGLKTNENTAMLPSDVPGFGRTNKETIWGFNYQIFIRLPIPKRK